MAESVKLPPADRKKLPAGALAKPSQNNTTSKTKRRYAIRLWSVRHARALEWFYKHFANLFLALHPLWKRLGYQRAEAPVRFVEKQAKGLLFDCQMCGQCALSSTGMSCPMNCPKELRNGPCGGVRANGNCEVKPDMPCVWVQAYTGSEMMVGGNTIGHVQPAIDQSLRGSSSWLRVTKAAGDAKDGAQ